MTLLKKKRERETHRSGLFILRLNIRLFKVFLHSNFSMTKLIISISLNNLKLLKREFKSYLSILAQIKSHTLWETFSNFSDTL